jgi:peptidoglycan hydrolase CwlO-like protein
LLSPFQIDFNAEDFMDILAAIKREERRLEKQLGKIQHQLNGVRAAAKALGDTANREVTSVKKRVLSAAGRAKIRRAAKRRWAKVRAQAKKVKG